MSSLQTVIAPEDVVGLGAASGLFNMKIGGDNAADTRSCGFDLWILQEWSSKYQ
jgi:hypothetical protein